MYVNIKYECVHRETNEKCFPYTCSIAYTCQHKSIRS